MLPNKKKETIQRLMRLKRRFMKDNKFFQDYLKFMDNLLRSGYARRSDASPSGKTWYIPHHGVYHPQQTKENLCCVWLQCGIQGKIYQQGIAIRTRFDKSGYWCLDNISWRKNCLHGRCRSYVSLSPGSRGSAVIFKIPVMGESWYRQGASWLCNVCTCFWCNIVSQLSK